MVFFGLHFYGPVLNSFQEMPVLISYTKSNEEFHDILRTIKKITVE